MLSSGVIHIPIIEKSFRRMNSISPSKINATKGEASNISVFPYAERAIIFLTGDKMGSVTAIMNRFSLFSLGMTTNENKKRTRIKPSTILKKTVTAVRAAGPESMELMPFSAISPREKHPCCAGRP
jgi:hypothetical protein